MAPVARIERRLTIAERGGTRRSDNTPIMTAPQNQISVAIVERYCGDCVGIRTTKKSNASKTLPSEFRKLAHVGPEDSDATSASMAASAEASVAGAAAQGTVVSTGVLVAVFTNSSAPTCSIFTLVLASSRANPKTLVL